MLESVHSIIISSRVLLVYDLQVEINWATCSKRGNSIL